MSWVSAVSERGPGNVILSSCSYFIQFYFPVTVFKKPEVVNMTHQTLYIKYNAVLHSRMSFVHVVFFLISTHTPLGRVTLLVLVLGVLTESSFDNVRVLDLWPDVLEGCGSATSRCEAEFVVSRNRRRLSPFSGPSEQLAPLYMPLLFRGLDSTSE